MTRDTELSGLLILIVLALGMFVPSVQAQTFIARLDATSTAVAGMFVTVRIGMLGETDQSVTLQPAHSAATSSSTSNSTSTISLVADTLTITNDGSTQLPFKVAGLVGDVSVVVLLNGPNGTLSESSGSANGTGTYSGSLSYQGSYSGPATLSATDNLGDISNILNVTITH